MERELTRQSQGTPGQHPSSVGAAKQASSYYVRSVLSAWHRERHTSVEESPDQAMNSGRVDFEDKTGKKGKSCKTMYAELGDGVD